MDGSINSLTFCSDKVLQVRYGKVSLCQESKKSQAKKEMET